MAIIVHVGSFSLKPKGAFINGIAPKITNGLIRNSHFVVWLSDRDAARAASLLGHRKFGIGGANKALRGLCQSVRPDVLVLGHADVIRPETVAAIRSDLPKLRVLQWNVDPMFETDNVNRILKKIDVVDATLVTTPGEALAPLRRKGMALGFMPNPVDFSIEEGRNDLDPSPPYDIFCAAGGLFPRRIGGQDITLQDLSKRIRAALPDLRTWFAGVDVPGMSGAPFRDALKSAGMGLNASRRNDIHLYTSDRLAQFCGNGMLAVIDRATGYNEYLSEDQAAFFSTIDEMIEKIGHYAAHPAERQAAATAGRARYHELFNEQIVAKYLLDVALGQCNPKDYPWPTLVE